MQKYIINYKCISCHSVTNHWVRQFVQMFVLTKV